MIPRLKKLDAEFEAAIHAYVRARSRSTGILGQIGSHVIHEGRSNTVHRSSIETEITKMKEANAEVRMEYDDIESVDLNYIVNKATEIAVQFERQFSEHLFTTLDDVTKQTGLRHDGGGVPLTNDAIMDAVSKMHVDFDESGRPTFSIVAPPSMMATFEKLQAEMERDPVLQKRWHDLMEMKRDEFRTREINRNLAG